MKIIDIFKNSLGYPIIKWKRFLTLWILVVLLSLIGYFSPIFLNPFNYLQNDLIIFFGFSMLIFLITIISGYSIDIIKSTIHNNEVSYIKFYKNIIIGVKVLILGIFYYIIPTIFMFITASTEFLTVFYFYISSIFKFAGLYPEILINIPTDTLVPTSLIFIPFYSTMDIVFAFITTILFIVFTVFFISSKVILAKDGKIIHSINFNSILNSIKDIGIRKYTLWLFIMIIFIALILEIQYLVNYFDSLIMIFCISLLITYFIIFNSRAIGLLYKS